MIHLSQSDFNAVMEILNKNIPNSPVWAFGSRVHGKNLKKFSDLDLVILPSFPSLANWQLASLSDDFSESNLPFKVDVLEWSRISTDFRQAIASSYLSIQQSKQPFHINIMVPFTESPAPAMS